RNGASPNANTPPSADACQYPPPDGWAAMATTGALSGSPAVDPSAGAGPNASTSDGGPASSPTASSPTASPAAPPTSSAATMTTPTTIGPMGGPYRARPAGSRTPERRPGDRRPAS